MGRNTPLHHDDNMMNERSRIRSPGEEMYTKEENYIVFVAGRMV